MGDINFENSNPQMKTGKATGWGNTFSYHWVSLPMTGEQSRYLNFFEEQEKWCKEQFGKSGARWFVKGDKFYFKSEKDMTVFILRWS